MITSFIEFLELSNVGHITTSTIWFDSRDRILLVTLSTEIMTFFSKYLQFADIIKIATLFIKTNFKDSNEVEKIINIY